MEFGAVFPQTEIGNDPAAIRDYAQAAEELGFKHLLFYDHVLGADRNRPGGFNGPYDKDTPFHEPFVTMGYLAGLTSTIEFSTSVLILPQRQTALVAKQAAQIDVLSSGRLRLGVGTGWNDIEYEALGEDFHNRGKRQEEQVELMRELWTNESVSFEGKWHKVTQAGLNPMPTRKIPVWFGGTADVVIERAARMGDGWFPLFGHKQSKDSIEKLHELLSANNRNPAEFGIQAQSQIARGNPERWAKNAEAWREMGTTHLAIATMNAGLKTAQEHIDAIRTYKESVS